MTNYCGAILTIFSCVFAVTSAGRHEHSLHLADGENPPCTGVLSQYCDCTLLEQGGIAAKCSGGQLNKLLGLLPVSLTDFSYTVETFTENGVNFSKFSKMERLRLLWSRDPSELIHYKPHNFLNPDIFDGLTSLMSLRISIPTAWLPPRILTPLINLQSLDLSNTGYLNTSTIRQVYNESRLKDKPLDNLVLMRVAGVNEDEYGSFYLKDLMELFHGSTITKVDISYNNDLFLYPGLIKFLPKLQELRLSGNRLRYKQHRPDEANCAVIDLALHENIRLVDLSDMKTIGFQIDFFALKFIPEVVACMLLGLPNCICTAYKISCGGMVGGITCDNIPDYTSSELRNDTCFLHLELPLPRSIEYVYVNKTQFTFGPGPMQRKLLCFKPSNLKVLNSGNISFPMTSTGGNMTILGWQNLTELSVQDSSWGYFFHNPEFIQSMPSIAIFRASGTNIGTYIRNDTENVIFLKSTRMLELYLDNSNITSIPFDEFSNLDQLQKLSLVNNGLSAFTFHMRNLTSLKHLDLSRNEFISLPIDVRNELDRLGSINHLELDLSDNHLACDCKNIDFVSWFHTTNVIFKNNSTYLCTSESTGSEFLADVNITLLIIDCYKTYIILGSCILLILLILVVVLVIYRCRRRIGYFCLWMKYRNDLDDELCDQDGFVIYTDEDRFWVHDVMLDKMENQMGLKLAVHHRDFVPGHYIDDQILNFIQNSRKTIVILSQSFLDSPWCNYELQIARHRLQTEGKDVIIPIILSALPEEKMNPTLKQILSEKTYLKWEEDDEGQKYFWKKLHLAIRRKVKPRVITLQVSKDASNDTTILPPNVPQHEEDDNQPLLNDYGV